MTTSVFSVFDGHTKETHATSVLVAALKMSPWFNNRALELWGFSDATPPTWCVVQREVRLTGDDDVPPERRIDFLIRGEVDKRRFAIGVEVKLFAPFGENQVRDYYKWISSRDEEIRGLILLVPKQKESEAETEASSLQTTDECPIRTKTWEDLRQAVKSDSTNEVPKEQVTWLQELNSYIDDVVGGFEGLPETFGRPDQFASAFSAYRKLLNYVIAQLAGTPVKNVLKTENSTWREFSYKSLYMTARWGKQKGWVSITSYSGQAGSSAGVYLEVTRAGKLTTEKLDEERLAQGGAPSMKALDDAAGVILKKWEDDS